MASWHSRGEASDSTICVAPGPASATLETLAEFSVWTFLMANCHATGCDAYVRATYLMCRRHWFMVPGAIQAAVNTQYRIRPFSAKYFHAARAAIVAVAECEGIAPDTRAYDDALRRLGARDTYRL